jgi:hypothetical protein
MRRDGQFPLQRKSRPTNILHLSSAAKHSTHLPLLDSVDYSFVLRLQQLMHGFRGKARMRYLMRIRERLLAYALAFHKYHGLQQQVILPSFTLNVVHHVGQPYVSVESKNRHKNRADPVQNFAAARLIPSTHRPPFKNH